MTAAKAQNNKDYYFKYSKICYKNNKNYYLKFATKIIKITIFNIKNPTFRVCQRFYKNNKFSYKKGKVYK